MSDFNILRNHNPVLFLFRISCVLYRRYLFGKHGTNTSYMNVVCFNLGIWSDRCFFVFFCFFLRCRMFVFCLLTS